MTQVPPDPGFGILQLDALLEPVPEGSALLLTHDPGLEADAFLFQSCRGHLQSGGSVIYLTTSRAPSAVLHGMEMLGFGTDIRSLTRLHFVDAYSALLAGAENVDYPVNRPNDITAILQALEKATKEHPGSLILIDSLSGLIDNTSWTAVNSTADRLMVALASGARSISLFTLWPYEEALDALFQRFGSHATVRAVEDRVTFSQYFRVVRAQGKTKVDDAPRVYKILPPTGVVVYVPKIVVTGPSGSGKTTFLRSACESLKSVERGGTTVALDHGRVTMDGLVADVFGTPGEARFDPILSTIAGQALGVLVVVDATRPETFARAREMLTKTWKQGLPAVVVANKSDLPGAQAAKEIARRMELPPRVRAVACQGNDPEQSRKVLKDLIDQILHRSVAA